MASLVRRLLDRAPVSAAKGSRPKPADSRPYRRQSETGPEMVTTTDTHRQTWRQVGWIGQTGAFYSLDEKPSLTEPGSFSPLWFIAHADRLDDAPALPRRGDAVEAWLKACRDDHSRDHDTQWDVIDQLLDTYRLHADTGTPLDEHVCEGGTVDDCASCYDAKEAGRG